MNASLSFEYFLESLSQLERARHENVLRELSFKIQAMHRAEEVDTMLKKRKRTKVDLESSASKEDV